jgi:hypothetical protein
MDVVEQLKTALRCPCCLKKPQPVTASVGMCNNGHMTCESCAKKIITRPPAVCPVCREPSFNVARGHCLAVSVLEILTAFLLYSCRYSSCTVQLNGPAILQHQQQCPYKPVRCPSLDCSYRGPIGMFMDGFHDSCITVYDALVNGVWAFGVEFSKVYCFDDNIVNITTQFKTILLRGTTLNGYVSRAFINVTFQDNGIVIYAGWMDNRDQVETKYTRLKIDIFAYINTASGEIGHYSSRFPIFGYEQGRIESEDGVHISKNMIYNWAKWSGQHRCHECNIAPPHFHVRVQFNEP